MENYNKAGLFIAFSQEKEKFVIGYKPRYFHDASFASLITPLTNEKISDIEDLLPKIKFTNLFDCESKSSFSIKELEILDKYIQMAEFKRYLNDISDKKKMGANKDLKLLKISSIINNINKKI